MKKDIRIFNGKQYYLYDVCNVNVEMHQNVKMVNKNIFFNIRN